MNLRRLAFLPLIFLGAAAAPQSDCGANPGASQALPGPLDLAARPLASPGLAGQVFATLPAPEVSAGCQSPLPTSGQPGTLRSDSNDILHGLPMPDITQPISDPKRSPYYR